VVGRELILIALPYAADDLATRRALAAEVEHMTAQASGTLPYAAFHDTALLHLEGRWTEAREPILAVRGLVNNPTVQLLLAHALGPLARDQGDSDLAWALVRESLPTGSAAVPGEGLHYFPVLGLQRLAAALALDAGDLPTARGWLAAHGRWLAWNGTVLGQSEGQALWARCYRTAGDPAQAREHGEHALAHASEPRQPLALLTAHRLLGELDTSAGRHADATGHLEHALALADACAAPYERALTLLALAELRAATGDVWEAAALLDEARAICTPLSARPALARAEALTSKLTRAAPAPANRPAGLTAREVEILRLVAEGLSNAEVAARLSLSPRTVNGHLTAIYGKLGVTSRSAAVRFALDHGLR
jgi:DNA-binding CsgD family transcriptional regulator